MGTIQRTSSMALVPVSPARDHQVGQQRSGRAAREAHGSAQQGIDRVDLSPEVLAYQSSMTESNRETIAPADTPKTREAVRTHYAARQTAAASNQLIPPGSRLNILV